MRKRADVLDTQHHTRRCRKSLVGDLPPSSGALTRFVLSMDEHAATCWHERRGMSGMVAGFGRRMRSRWRLNVSSRSPPRDLWSEVTGGVYCAASVTLLWLCRPSSRSPDLLSLLLPLFLALLPFRRRLSFSFRRSLTRSFTRSLVRSFVLQALVGSRQPAVIHTTDALDL